MIDRPLVSIIVPAYNAEKTLDTFLKSVAKQSYTNIEVVLVDDGSTDRTGDIAKEFNFVKYIKNETNIGRQESRNIGFENSKGRYVWFMDSDMELTPGIIKACVNTVENKRLDGVLIPERSKGKGLWAKSRGFEKILNDDDLNKNSIRFMRREVALAIKHNPKIGVADDYEFHNRAIEMGYDKVKMIQNGYIYHNEVSSILNMMRKYFRYGKTLLPYIKNYPKQSVLQFNFFRMAYLRNYKMFLKHPFLGLTMFFCKTLQYLAACLGIICYFFSRNKKVVDGISYK